MNYKALETIALTILNWIAALVGVTILCAGFAFLPALFGFTNDSTTLFQINGLLFSKGVAGVFPFGWSIGILIIGTFLYTWICSIFSMSTHLMIVSAVHEYTYGGSDGDRLAWSCVAFMGILLTLGFVYVLYGTLFNVLSISLVLLLVTLISFILVLNYTDSQGQWQEMKIFS